MLDQHPDALVYATGFTAVALVAYARYRLGPHYFNDRARFWAPVRSILIPVLDRVLRDIDDELYATNHASRREYVATIPRPPPVVLDQLAAHGYQPQPLAGYKTNWQGREEAASWARYHGPRPWPGAPNWLRPRQVHVTLFPAQDGAGTVVTAHEEANPWRPDTWFAHYRGIAVSVREGRHAAAHALDVDLEPLPAAGLHEQT